MCSDAPDTSGINAAAVNNAAIAKESLDFYKSVYAEGAGARERAANTAEEVSRQQLASSKLNDSISRDYWDYQKGTFRPLEAGIVADAQKFDTPERREAEAAAAGADVSTQAAAARATTQRQQASMGVNPNSGRAQALDAQMSVAEAAAKAGAMNTARKGVELQGYARRMDAANLGRGLASNQATSAGVALTAGNAATGNANAAVQVQQQGAQLMQNGFSTAIQGNQSAGSLYGQAAQIDAASGPAGTLGALGQLAGGAAAVYKSGMFASDEDLKSGVQAVDDEQALDGIKKTPVKSWRYDPAKGGPDDGGQIHVGPMAGDVQKNMGDEVAPGGKVIDSISMHGRALQGIRALSARQDSQDRAIQKLVKTNTALLAAIKSNGIRGKRA